MLLRLRVRTPQGVLLDRPVRDVTAEDRSGWFGILPGRSDLIASLPPGLLLFHDEEGEGFVALAGGLLDLRRGECRIMAREAVVARALAEVSSALHDHLAERKRRAAGLRDVVDDLAKEALRRLAAEQAS